jgi:hypothetical protein
MPAGLGMLVELAATSALLTAENNCASPKSVILSASGARRTSDDACSTSPRHGFPTTFSLKSLKPACRWWNEPRVLRATEALRITDQPTQHPLTHLYDHQEKKTNTRNQFF